MKFYVKNMKYVIYEFFKFYNGRGGGGGIFHLNLNVSL